MSSHSPSITERQVEAVLHDWSSEPSQIASALLDRYGSPAVVTSRRLVWEDCGDWKRSTLHRAGVEHEFPESHADYLEQVLGYRVPTEKTADVCRFKGSVTTNRTRGRSPRAVATNRRTSSS